MGRRRGEDEPDMRAYWPMRLTQIVGGKRWSLSLIQYRTPGPVFAKEVRDELVAGLNGKDVSR